MQQYIPVTVPIYDFTTHSRTGNVQLNSADVIIVEGILSMYSESVRSQMHMKIFVDEDADVCLVRRMKRDILSRGRSVNSVLIQYERFVKPAFDEFIVPTKRYADIIVPRGGENHVAIDLIIQHIAHKLKQDDLRKIYPQLHLLQDNSQMIRRLHTIFRDGNTSRDDFIFHTDRLIRLVVEYGLGLLPFKPKLVKTPIGETYFGVEFASNLVGLSVIRGGETMENALKSVGGSGIQIAKVLIERPTNSKKSHGDRKVGFHSIPHDIAQHYVFVMDAVVDSGRTVVCALEELIVNRGCQQDKIIYLGILASPDAIRLICNTFPGVRVVTTAIDKGCNEEGYSVPGIGDFADRYFGTES